jgi:PhnB protein
MASLLNPYINFDGNARVAMEFYQDVLGGTLTMNTFGEFGDKDSPIADQIMHAMLVTDNGFTIMASDTPPGMSYQPGNNVGISLSGDDGEALRGYWERLIVDGTVATPLAKQMWGDEFGSCTDRFGIGWLVNISQS